MLVIIKTNVINIKKMNKIEFYNSLIKLRKSSGQGFPEVLKCKLPDSSIIDELIEDGLVKKVEKKFNYLPNDVVICLTDGYCVEEDYINDISALSYIRFYLCVNEDNISYDDIVKNAEFIRGYSEWLTKNEIKLKEMMNIKFLEDNSDKLSKSDIEYLKTRSWYIKNESISESLKKLDSNFEENNIQKVQILTELVSIKKRLFCLRPNDPENDDLDETIKELEKAKEDVKNSKNILKCRNRIKKFLELQNKETKIQNII